MPDRVERPVFFVSCLEKSRKEEYIVPNTEDGRGKEMDLPVHQFLTEDFFRPNWSVSVHLVRNGPDEYPFEYTSLNQRQFWKIMYIVKGHAVMIINNRKYELPAGSAGLIHPSDLTTLALTEDVLLYNVLFQRDAIESELKDLCLKEDFFSIFRQDADNRDPIRHDILHLMDSNRTIYAIIRKMYHEYQSDEVFSRELLKTYLLELLYSLARQSFSSSLKSRRAFAPEYIKSTLQKNFRNPPDIRSLMQKTGLTRNELFRLYKAETGETMGQTVLRFRLGCALDLLKNTDLPVSEICAMAGFTDLSNFYRVFRRTIGHSPGFFREKRNGDRENASGVPPSDHSV